jgi:guanylate kinase
LSGPKPVVIVLHGPAGAGKDAVIDLVRARTGINRATSSTTRPPREGEHHGDHYYFLSREEFEDGITAGDFAEWANVYDDLKGVHRSEIEGPISRGEDLIIRTDVQGAREWRKRLTGAVFVFLMAEDADPDKSREALRSRLLARKSETPESLARRLAEFNEELADIPNNDHVVVNRNGHLEDAVHDIETIVERERANPGRGVPRLLASGSAAKPPGGDVGS